MHNQLVICYFYIESWYFLNEDVVGLSTEMLVLNFLVPPTSLLNKIRYNNLNKSRAKVEREN